MRYIALIVFAMAVAFGAARYLGSRGFTSAPHEPVRQVAVNANEILAHQR